MSSLMRSSTAKRPRSFTSACQRASWRRCFFTSKSLPQQVPAAETLLKLREAYVELDVRERARGGDRAGDV